MATYNDFDGVYFTLQALQLYEDLQDTELLVIDNYGCSDTKQLVEERVHGRYVLAAEVRGTAPTKDLVFREARGEAVLCCDSHVLFAPGVIRRLKEYYREHPDCPDLLQGPLVYDDAQSISTHFEPEWSSGMWGTWATDPRGCDPEGEPFEIPMQGMGVFSCRKGAWPGFNPMFRGFGGEEGYIHEKFRRAGGRCLCLPWFRWMHRFARPAGVQYPLTVDEKLRNYLIGHAELGLDPTPVLAHFSEIMPEDRVVAVAAETLWGPQALEPMAATPPEVNAGTAGGGAAPETLSEGAGQGSPQDRRVPIAVGDGATRRAIVCFVGDKRHLIQQALALRHSWLYAQAADTDLVIMGPAHVLARLPDDVVKIEQRSVEDDAEWHGYHFADSITCMNGAGAEQLDRYTHILRTDVDTFITPAWNDFHPTSFVFGENPHYARDDEVRQRLREIAVRYGLVHRGLTNINSTWYGPTEVVRQASAFTEMLMKHILTHYFSDYEGEWPGWYRGVASLYAGEIAVNHCAPDAQRSELLDASSTSQEPLLRYAHIHCWHRDEKFSKHAFMGGRYTLEDARDLDLHVVRDYCMAMSFRSLGDLKVLQGVEEKPRRDVVEHTQQQPDEEAPVAASVATRNSSDAGVTSRSAHTGVTPKATLPLVSCICPTYNRPPHYQHLLEEAIASYLRQDFPNKELIILNDCLGQELIFDGPGVRVVNVPKRFPSIGDKLNAAVSLARGELIAPWDDDDISLPWRLSLSVERLGDANYFNPRCYWLLDNDGLHVDRSMGYAHNASLFRRAAFERVGGYPSVSLGADAALDAAFSKLADGVDPRRGDKELTRSEWFYIYRWGVNPVHMSGSGVEDFYGEVGKLPVVEGSFHLSPHWRRDYIAETRQMLERSR
jgi:glycosyltransferase involved in cell wall biosynthesis